MKDLIKTLVALSALMPSSKFRWLREAREGERPKISEWLRDNYPPVSHPNG